MLDPAEQSAAAEQPNSAVQSGPVEPREAAEPPLHDEPSDVVAAAVIGRSSALTEVQSQAPPPNAPDLSAPLWLRRSDQLFVGTLLVVLLVLLTAHWLKLSRWGTASVELTSLQPREYFYSLDINTASWVEWAQLDGIGEKLAKRIVADRAERGPFRDANDVGRVRGIHLKQLDSMQPFLRGGTASEVSEP